MGNSKLVSLQLPAGKLMIRIAAAIFIVVLALSSSTKVFAQGNLLITPRRVVFEGSLKTQELTLANTGNEVAKYNISIVQYRMKEDGSFEEITEPDPGQNFADKYVRFFPRTVTLAPKESQVVKMQLTKTNTMAPGEYRSHVYFRAVPNETALGEEKTQADSTAISVRLVPIFGITVPVIIRIGESNTTVALSDLTVKAENDTLSRLSLTLNRSGNMSVYGDLSVVYKTPDGVATEVGIVNGIAVYTPNSLRRFQMDLKKLPEVDYHKGTLYVSYSTQSDKKPEKLAGAELQLN